MICNYLLLYHFVISVCFVASIVGRKAIIGGAKARVHDFSYVISMEVNDESICGGGIIDAQFILTAAHCVLSPYGNFLGQQISILASTKDTRKKSHPAVIVRVNKIFVPKEFNRFSLNTTGDIAVLRLAYPFDFTRHKHLKRLELPKNAHDHYVGKTVKIAGFGWDWVQVVNGYHEIGGNRETKLRYLEANVFTKDVCQQSYPCRVISDRQICAKAKAQSNNHIDGSRAYGVCAGDSGGPLVYGQTIVGILVISPFGCSEEHNPAIYTRVTHYLHFIRRSMRDEYQKDVRTLEVHF